MRERLCRWALAAVSLVLCALFALMPLDPVYIPLA